MIKKHIRKILIIISLLAVGLTTALATSVYAASSDTDSSCQLAFEHNVETTYFGNVSDSGDGCSVFKVLNLAVNVAAGAVGVCGMAGIVVVGIMFISSKQDEQMAAKAKKRLLEIIIGLALAGVLYSVLSFLLPGGTLNSGGCGTGVVIDSLII